MIMSGTFAKLRFGSITMLIVIAIVGLSGCQKTGWVGPAGPMNQQQAVAAVHDPFPLNDIGPSDSAMRPPGYEQPLPEPVRNRIGPDAMPWLGQ
jgi:hypothetical protein